MGNDGIINQFKMRRVMGEKIAAVGFNSQKRMSIMT